MRILSVAVLLSLLVSSQGASLSTEPSLDSEELDAFEVTDDALDSLLDREATWDGIWLQSDTRVHVNLNQPAKAVDMVLVPGEWFQVFHLEAPFREEDTIHFCGASVASVIIYDGTYDIVLHNDVVEVVACK